MRVGYSRTLAGLIFSSAVLVLALNVIKPPANVMAIVGAVAGIVMGAAYAYRPYFELRGDELIVFAPLSPAKKRYVLSEGALLIRDGKIRHQGRTLPVRRLYADKAQWERFVQAVTARAFA